MKPQGQTPGRPPSLSGHRGTRGMAGGPRWRPGSGLQAASEPCGAAAGKGPCGGPGGSDPPRAAPGGGAGRAGPLAAARWRPPPGSQRPAAAAVAAPGWARDGPGAGAGRRQAAGPGQARAANPSAACRSRSPRPRRGGAAAPPQASGVGPGGVPRPGARDRRPCPLRRGEGTSRAMPPCSRGEAARQPGPKAPAKGSLPLGTTALHRPPPTSLVTGGKVRLHGDAVTRTLPSLAQRGVPEDRWLPFLVGREEANVGSFLKYGRRAEHQVQLSA